MVKDDPNIHLRNLFRKVNTRTMQFNYWYLDIKVLWLITSFLLTVPSNGSCLVLILQHGSPSVMMGGLKVRRIAMNCWLFAFRQYVLLDMTTCSAVEYYRRFEGSFCLHLQCTHCHDSRRYQTLYVVFKYGVAVSLLCVEQQDMVMTSQVWK